MLALILVSCETRSIIVPAHTDPATLEEVPEVSVSSTGFSDKTITTGDTVATTVTSATTLAAPLVPEPYKTILLIGIPLLAAAWEKVKNVKLTKGARITASVLRKEIKSTDVWNTVGPALAEAESDFKILKPTMPDKV